MSNEQALAINKLRLDQWAKIASDNTATACLMVAIGHGRQLGQVHLFVVEDMPDEDTLKMLDMVREKLVAQINKRS